MGLFDGRAQASGLCRLDNCNNSERSSSRRFIKNNEAPYQLIGKPSLESTFGYKELSCTHFWLSVVSECLSCCLYVLIVCSTRISWTGRIIGHQPNLIAMALSSGIAMMLLIFAFRTVHVNPALTLSFLATGRIPICRAIIYIFAHCFGSIAAIAFLHTISIQGHNGALGLDNPHEILQSWQILIVEMVISFVVTLVTYATCNYSSYTCAKKLILEQLGHSSSSLFQNQNNHDNDASAHPRHSRRSVVVPIVPQLSSSNSYDDSTNYDYEYDNHRIYATQQLKSESSSQVPMEEVMQEECQLLAPNGFSLHVTSGQALVIGLAYTLASLSGIPASGASLNPARSLGPAFIMNRWDQHWVYWIGPILGAIMAGMFYEFIFNPTRKSSLCYRPKLFRFSAQDMAKVGSKSRLHQHQQQLQRHQAAMGPTAPFHPSTIYRPHNQTPQHPQTSRSSNTDNPLASPGPLKSPWEQHLITNSTSVAHLQSSYPGSNTFDQMNFVSSQLQQQQQHQLSNAHHQTANFDRSKSTAIINSIAQKHQSTINIAKNRNNPDQGPQGVVYDDPNIGAANKFRQMDRHSATMATQLGFSNNVLATDLQQQQQQQHLGQVPMIQNDHRFQVHHQRQQLMNGNHINKPFDTMMMMDQRPLSLQVDDRFHDRANGRIVGQVVPTIGNQLLMSQEDRNQQYLNDKFSERQQLQMQTQTQTQMQMQIQQQRQQHQHQQQTNLDQLDDDMYNVLDDDDQDETNLHMHNDAAMANTRASNIQTSDNNISPRTNNNNDLDSGYVNNHHHHQQSQIHSNGTPETSDSSSSQRTGEMNSSSIIR